MSGQTNLVRSKQSLELRGQQVNLVRSSDLQIVPVRIWCCTRWLPCWLQLALDSTFASPIVRRFTRRFRGRRRIRRFRQSWGKKRSSARGATLTSRPSATRSSNQRTRSMVMKWMTALDQQSSTTRSTEWQTTTVPASTLKCQARSPSPRVMSCASAQTASVQWRRPATTTLVRRRPPRVHHHHIDHQSTTYNVTSATCRCQCQLNLQLVSVTRALLLHLPPINWTTCKRSFCTIIVPTVP